MTNKRPYLKNLNIREIPMRQVEKNEAQEIYASLSDCEKPKFIQFLKNKWEREQKQLQRIKHQIERTRTRTKAPKKKSTVRRLKISRRRKI
tara:strand:+ start:7220 stop:7492 length:273 start_codon:yes stop_codon:yes gene_type:complete